MSNYPSDIASILEVVTEIRDLLRKQVPPPKQDVTITCPRCLGSGNDRSRGTTCGFCEGQGKVIMTIMKEYKPKGT